MHEMLDILCSATLRYVVSIRRSTYEAPPNHFAPLPTRASGLLRKARALSQSNGRCYLRNGAGGDLAPGGVYACINGLIRGNMADIKLSDNGAFDLLLILQTYIERMTELIEQAIKDEKAGKKTVLFDNYTDF